MTYSSIQHFLFIHTLRHAFSLLLTSFLFKCCLMYIVNEPDKILVYSSKGSRTLVDD